MSHNDPLPGNIALKNISMTMDAPTTAEETLESVLPFQSKTRQ
jgi:hypothetical protein